VTAIEVERLHRTYRTGKGWRPRGPEVVALDAFTLAVPFGEVHGLLGPNGAGKTTLCKILSTILLPTSGTARVLGYDVVAGAAAVRPRLGIVFGGERGLYTRLTARQNLLYWAALYRLPDRVARERAAGLLDRLGLADRADVPVRTFSRGMKQRLHLARGLVGDPAVVLFDEPTAGLDPVAAHEFRRLLVELRDQGRTILVATHDMAEAEQVCDRVSFIDGGRLITSAAPHELASTAGVPRTIEARGVGRDTAARLRAVAGVLEATDAGGVLRLRTDGDGTARHVVDTLVSAGAREVRLVPPSLADVYRHLVGSRGMEV
jgi:ABC-2 type transport system ATP-binding protein